jgi:hypothetical protein
MNICIIGAGFIGGTLGKKWSEAGHTITFGVRNPENPKYAAYAAVGNITTIPAALENAEVVLLSLPGAAVNEFASQYGASLERKLVIDATNNPRSPVMNNLEALKIHAPQAHVIRAFSTLGGENFADPQLGGVQIDLFFCGHAPSRPVAEQLISEVGLRPVYMGDLDAVNAVDGLTRAWFALAFSQARGRRIAFKLLEE